MSNAIPTPADPPDDWADPAADVAALFARTAPEAPPWAPAAVGPARASRVRPLFRKSFVMKCSALALTAAGLAAAAVWWSPAAAEARVVTLQDVKDAVRGSKLVTATVYYGGAEERSEAGPQFLFALDLRRARTGGSARGPVSVQDYRAGTSLWTSPDDGTVRFDRFPAGRGTPLSLLDYENLSRQLDAGPTEVGLDGRDVLRFDVVWKDRTRREPDGSRPRERVRVWVDPQTKRPVRWESGEGETRFILKEIEWADAYDPRLFTAALPAVVEADLVRTAGRPWEGMLSEKSRESLEKLGGGPYAPLPADPAAAGALGLDAAFGPALTPGEGFGPLKLGMTRAEVEAATGVPTFWSGPDVFWLFLPSQSLTAWGTAEDGVAFIALGAGWKNGFPGTIAGGPAAGASVAEVERSLGPPDRAYDIAPHPEAPDLTRAARRYDDRRLKVDFWNDAAVAAAIWSPAAEPVWWDDPTAR